MKESLYIIVDVSGSMNEMGKIHLQRNLCRYVSQMRFIDQKKYSGFNICFYKWAQNLSEIVLQSNEDIPALCAEGSSDLRALSDFVTQYLNDNRKLKVLILSDGNFHNLDIISFKNQMDIFSGLIIRTVAVGADANLLKLKQISTNNTVYLPENITSAIDSIVFGSDEVLTAPISTACILRSMPGEVEKLEEGWDG